MKIAVLGASGRVGKCLITHILADANDQLAGAYVSAQSQSLGKQVDGSDLSFQTLEDPSAQAVDLMIDFSTPAATMALLNELSLRSRALVIGTTGFTREQEKKIEQASRHSAIMIGANFAKSFEVFVASCRKLVAAHPQDLPQLEETYHARKKAVPSGTSLRLARELADARKQAGAETHGEIPIKVNREGDVTGNHVCRVSREHYEISISFTVEGLGSYARGALAAGHWLEDRANGLYIPADMLENNFNSDSLSFG